MFLKSLMIIFDNHTLTWFTKTLVDSVQLMFILKYHYCSYNHIYKSFKISQHKDT